MKPQTIVDLSAENLVSIVAERAYNSIAHAWTLQNESGSHGASASEPREPHIVITGGRTGIAIAKALDLALHRGVSFQSAFAGKKVHIWFSDERFVDLESAERSDTTLIGGFTRARELCVFHRVAVPADCTLEQAAAQYALELDNFLGLIPTRGEGEKASNAGARESAGLVTSGISDSTNSSQSSHASHASQSANFEVTILSMGEDGHIASLFPGQEEVLNSSLSAISVDNSPKPPALRVSIGVARLASSSSIYIFAVGESKREPLREIMEETSTGPISALRAKFAGNQFFMVTDIRL